MGESLFFLFLYIYLRWIHTYPNLLKEQQQQHITSEGVNQETNTLPCDCDDYDIVIQQDDIFSLPEL